MPIYLYLYLYIYMHNYKEFAIIYNKHAIFKFYSSIVTITITITIL